MEEAGKSENLKERQPWTTDMMRENRDRWNLAADVGLLGHIKEFGNNLLLETENTLSLLDKLEADLNSSSINVSNIRNKFLSLADSQFVENRVYEDEEVFDISAANQQKQTESNSESAEDVLCKLKQSIVNGLEVLNTKFETVEVSNSDSEDDENNSSPTGIVYKPINLFNNRPLPHIIGSEEFMRDPTVGLEELLSESEEEEDIEEAEESFNTRFIRNDDEDLMDNEDSELERDRITVGTSSSNNNNNDNSDDSLFFNKQPSLSFVDHLSARLGNLGNNDSLDYTFSGNDSKQNQQQQHRDLFSTTPPPLDNNSIDDNYSNYNDYDNDNFSSNDDLLFDNSPRNSRPNIVDDLFVTKSKSSMWDDDVEDKVLNSNTISKNKNMNQVDKGNESKIIKDLEKRFAQGISNSGKTANESSSNISPSPPPLLNDEDEDFSEMNNNKIGNNEKSSLFDNKDADIDSLFGAVSVRKMSSSSSSQISQQFNKVSKNSESENPKTVTKKKLPAGAVNIFGTNSNIFKDSINKLQNNVENDSDIIKKSISSIRRKNFDDSDDEITKEEVKAKDTHEDADKISRNQKSVADNILKDSKDDLEDDEFLFKSSNDKSVSSRNSSVKLNESIHEDNISVKSNRSSNAGGPGLFDDILTTSKKSSIKQTMDDLFRDVNYDDDEDDDIFSNVLKKDKKSTNDSLFSSEQSSSSNSKNNIKNVVDDLFKDVHSSDDLFSNLSTKINSRPNLNNAETHGNDDTTDNSLKKSTKVVPSVFDDFDNDSNNFDSDIFKFNKKIDNSLNKNTTRSNNNSNDGKKSSQGLPSKKLFDDDDDDDEDDDLFGSSSNSSINKYKSANLINKELPKDNIINKVTNDEPSVSSDQYNYSKLDKSSVILTSDTVLKRSNDDKLFIEKGTNKNLVETAKVKSISLFANDDKLISNESIGNSNTNERIFSSSVVDSNKIVSDTDDLFSYFKSSLVSTNNDQVPSSETNPMVLPNNELFSESYESSHDDSLNNVKCIKYDENLDDSSPLFDEITSNDATNDVTRRDESSTKSSNVNYIFSDDVYEDNLFGSSVSNFDDDNNKKKDFKNFNKVDPNIENKHVYDSVDHDVHIKSSNIDNVRDDSEIKNIETGSVDVISNNYPTLNSSNNIFSSDSNRIKTADITSVPSVIKNESNLDKFNVNNQDDILFGNVSNDSVVNDNRNYSSLFTADTENKRFILRETRIIHDDQSSVEEKQNNLHDNSFDTNKCLPNLPPPINEVKSKLKIHEKPVSSTLLNKLEPPKSLNISSPLTASNSGIESMGKNETAADVGDGCTFSTESSVVTPPIKIIPGKLNLGKLNINPNKLLPGARPKSFKKPSTSVEEGESNLDLPKSDKSTASVESTKSVPSVSSISSLSSKVSDEESSESIIVSDHNKVTDLLNSNSVNILENNVTKDRAKIKVKRRPQTRKARQDAVRRSMMEGSYDIITNNDEVDSKHVVIKEKLIGNDNIEDPVIRNQKTEYKSDYSSISLFEDPSSNILSPSTDEDDLFGVPPLDLPPDYTKVITSPGDIFDNASATVISPGLNDGTDRKTTEFDIQSRTGNDNFLVNDKNDNLLSDSDLNINKNNQDALFKDITSKNNIAESKQNVFTDVDIFNDVSLSDINVKDELFNECSTESSDNRPKNVTLTDNSISEINFKQTVDNTENNLFTNNNNNNNSLNVFESNSKESNIKITSSKNEEDHEKDYKKSLFSDLDDVDDLFLNVKPVVKDVKPNDTKLDSNVNNDTDLFSSKISSANKDIIRDDESKSNLRFNNNEIEKNEVDLFSNNNSNNVIASSSSTNIGSLNKENNVLIKNSESNIICGVFNTGVVNICDKLTNVASNPSSNILNEDASFPQSDDDWTKSNKNKNNSEVISKLPEKNKNSLFGDDEGDDLFGTSNEFTKQNKMKVAKSEITDVSKSKIFSDEDESDNLFGEFKKTNISNLIKKNKNDMKNVSSEELDNSKSKKTINASLTPSSTIKNKGKASLFDSDDSENDDIFSSGTKIKSTSNKISTSSIKSGNSVKKNSKSSTVSKTAKSSESSDNFVDPLSALGNNE